MDQRDFVKLTSALYRVTDLFPDQEPLKIGLRERGLKVLSLLSPYHFSDDTNLDSSVAEASLKEVQALRSLLAVSQSQQWVNEINLILLDQEYGRLEDRLKSVVARKGSVRKTETPKPVEPASKSEPINVESAPKKPTPSELKPNRTYDVNTGQEVDQAPPSDRQEKILQMIRQQPRIQMRQIQEELTDVTSRTLRRDLESLVQQGKIVRVGRGTGTFYRVNFVDNS